ncbi:unnamed protein product, partial [Hymenolepis diminuta]
MPQYPHRNPTSTGKVELLSISQQCAYVRIGIAILNNQEKQSFKKSPKNDTVIATSALN